MKREVVQDFLNLPGVAGIALIDDRSRPYFFGVDRALNFQQKEVLVRGIRQVLGTIPPEFTSLEFQFTGHQLYIYKLDQGIIMLVLVHNSVDQTQYSEAINRLKVALEADLAKGVATFRLLVSEITMSKWQRAGQQLGDGEHSTLSSPESGGASRADSIPGSRNGRYPKTPPTSLTAETTQTRQLPPNSLIPPTKPAATPSDQSVVVPPTTPVQQQPPLGSALRSDQIYPADPSNYSGLPDTLLTPSNLPRPTLKEFVAALNVLSHFTTKYLGTAVIVNYLKTSRPRNDWLQSFEIDRGARIQVPNAANQDMSQPISPEQLQLLRNWVHSFVERCTRVIRDLPQLVHQSALTDRQKSILF
jgi:hypothetical protein